MIPVKVPRKKPFSCKCADSALAGVVQQSVWLLTNSRASISSNLDLPIRAPPHRISAHDIRAVLLIMASSHISHLGRFHP